MNYRKLLMCITCLSLVSAKLQADEVMALKVVLNDGTETLFVLPDRPVATLRGDSLLIASESMSVGYLRSDISECSFEQTDTVDTRLPATETNVLRYTYVDNRHVTIEGLEAGCKVAVYDAKGVFLGIQATAENNSELVIDLGELPAGMYMITITNQPTIKIIRR